MHMKYIKKIVQYGISMLLVIHTQYLVSLCRRPVTQVRGQLSSVCSLNSPILINSHSAQSHTLGQPSNFWQYCFSPLQFLITIGPHSNSFQLCDHNKIYTQPSQGLSLHAVQRSIIQLAVEYQWIEVEMTRWEMTDSMTGWMTTPQSSAGWWRSDLSSDSPGWPSLLTAPPCSPISVTEKTIVRHPTYKQCNNP